MRSPRLHRGRLAAVLLLTTTLAGCGGDDDAARVASRSAAARAPIPVAQPIALREGRIGDLPVSLELTQLRRRGRTVTLELRLRTRVETALDLAGALDDGVEQKTTDPSDDFHWENSTTLDGINLVDLANGRRFAPSRDRYGHCLCDRNVTGTTVSRDRPLALSATFAAPPPAVKAVDVVIPRFGTIPDVPLD